MPETTPQAPRVTPERIAALVAHYARQQGLTGRVRPGEDWTFTVAVVAGLMDPRSGGDAWALVVPKLRPDGDGGSAHVRVRDIDATPIPGFEGDPMLEIRVTISHELFHCIVAEATRGGPLTIPAEERIVEAAAKAVVRCESTGDARVMARSISAIPSALRARISASAGLRARGGAAMAMNIDTVKKLLDAIEGGDSAAMAEVCKQLVAEAASGGDAGAPAGGDMPPPSDGAAKVEPTPGADGGAVMPPATDDARRAKGAEAMSEDKARARKAADEATEAAAELKAIATAARPAAMAALVVGLRARLGPALKPASEKRIMDAPTFVRAKEIADLIEETIGDVAGIERARSGVEHEQNAGPERARSAMPTAAVLAAEGFSDSWLTGYASALRNPDPAVAAAFLEQGRASTRARTAQNGAK